MEKNRSKKKIHSSPQVSYWVDIVDISQFIDFPLHQNASVGHILKD